MDKILEVISSAAFPETAKPRDYEDAKKTYSADLPQLPPHEIVLSFDHILERIFSYLNTPGLLACRLVSLRFLKYARRPLENRITKTFNYITNGSFQFKDTRGSTLEQLIEFLVQSKSFTESNPNKISFPCTIFKFLDGELGNDILQQFLSIHGQNIRQLTVCSSSQTDENIFMDQLCSLLTLQAPHLETICLEAYLKVAWQQKIPNQGSRRRSSHLLDTDPEYQQISSRVESLSRKSSLKLIRIYGKGLAKTVEFLLQLSPKLQEVMLCYNTDLYLYLLKPANRMHLLKDMTFDPALPYEDDDFSEEDDDSNEEEDDTDEEDDAPEVEDNDSDEDNRPSSNMETMGKISVANHLRLRSLEICFREALRGMKANREFENKVVSIANRLLEINKDTLEHLILSCVTFLRGMKMPNVMPKLRNIEFIQFDNIGDTETFQIFPKGFFWTKAFPKLTSVEFSPSPEAFDDDLFYDFFNRSVFGGDGQALSFGVKKVIFHPESKPNQDMSHECIPAFIFERVYKLFPNAKIFHTGFCD